MKHHEKLSAMTLGLFFAEKLSKIDNLLRLSDRFPYVPMLRYSHTEGHKPFGNKTKEPSARKEEEPTISYLYFTLNFV